MLKLGAKEGSEELLFPSPYGDMVLKFETRMDDTAMKKRFPSPYGDMVLK